MSDTDTEADVNEIFTLRQAKCFLWFFEIDTEKKSKDISWAHKNCNLHDWNGNENSMDVSKEDSKVISIAKSFLRTSYITKQAVVSSKWTFIFSFPFDFLMFNKYYLYNNLMCLVTVRNFLMQSLTTNEIDADKNCSLCGFIFKSAMSLTPVSLQEHIIFNIWLPLLSNFQRFRR